MYKALVLVLVVTGLLWHREAWTQDVAARRKLADERAAVSVRAVDKSAKKEEGVQPSLKQEAISLEIQTGQSALRADLGNVSRSSRPSALDR